MKNKCESTPENTMRMNLLKTTLNILSRESLESSCRRENIFPLIFKPRKKCLFRNPIGNQESRKRKCKLNFFQKNCVGHFSLFVFVLSTTN